MTTAGDTANTDRGVIRIPVSIESHHGELPSHALAPDEPLAEGLSRIIVVQYDRMLDAFEASPAEVQTAVHTIRKSQKRIRALLRMIRPVIPDDVYTAENRRLRDVARALSDVRDSHIQVVGIAHLDDRFRGVVDADVFRDTEAWLKAARRRREVELLNDRTQLDHLRNETLAGRASWADGSAAHAAASISDRFASIEKGLGRTYRNGRKAYHRASGSQTTRSLHEWRKAVKSLRYQLEALVSMWPTLLEAQVARLDDLGALLGDEHDLAVLRSAIASSPGPGLASDAGWLLNAVITRRRLELRSEAMSTAPSLYTEESSAFVDRMRGYWVSGRTYGRVTRP